MDEELERAGNVNPAYSTEEMRADMFTLLTSQKENEESYLAAEKLKGAASEVKMANYQYAIELLDRLAGYVSNWILESDEEV